MQSHTLDRARKPQPSGMKACAMALAMACRMFLQPILSGLLLSRLVYETALLFMTDFPLETGYAVPDSVIRHVNKATAFCFLVAYVVIFRSIFGARMWYIYLGPISALSGVAMGAFAYGYTAGNPSATLWLTNFTFMRYPLAAFLSLPVCFVAVGAAKALWWAWFAITSLAAMGYLPSVLTTIQFQHMLVLCALPSVAWFAYLVAFLVPVPPSHNSVSPSLHRRAY